MRVHRTDTNNIKAKRHESSDKDAAARLTHLKSADPHVGARRRRWSRWHPVLGSAEWRVASARLLLLPRVRPAAAHPRKHLWHDRAFVPRHATISARHWQRPEGWLVYARIPRAYPGCVVRNERAERLALAVRSPLTDFCHPRRDVFAHRIRGRDGPSPAVHRRATTVQRTDRLPRVRPC